jgi:hypothetical protein
MSGRRRNGAGDRAISARPADLIGRKIANPRPATDPAHTATTRASRYDAMPSRRA